MGGGHFSPKPQTGDTATEQSTDSPQENTNSTETPDGGRGNNGGSAAAVSDTLDGEGRSGVEDKVGQSNITGGENDIYDVASMYDRGYSQQLAARVRDTSTDELQSEFNERVASNNINRGGDGKALSTQARFIGGVLVSRGDSDFTAEDLFDGTQDGIDSAVDNIDGEDYHKEAILEEMTRVFQDYDEYVAGQVASEIQELKIKNKGEDVNGEMGGGTLELDPDSVGSGHRTSFADYDEIDFDEFTKIRSLEEKAAGYDIFAHEMAHAFHQSLGLTATERQAPHQEDIPPDELTLNPTVDSSSAFAGELGDFPRREAFVERFKEHAENMVATLKADADELAELDSVVKPIQDYQTCDFAEMVAVGYDTYMSDIVLATNKQREMVETFDEFVTGDSWTETTVDDLDDHGVFYQHRQKSNLHVSSNDSVHRTQERDEVESTHNYGQVALFEFKEEIAPGRDYAAGYVDEVTENEVTFAYLGDKITVDRDNIESVKERKEMKEECLEKAR